MIPVLICHARPQRINGTGGGPSSGDPLTECGCLLIGDLGTCGGACLHFLSLS